VIHVRHSCCDVITVLVADASFVQCKAVAFAIYRLQKAHYETRCSTAWIIIVVNKSTTAAATQYRRECVHVGVSVTMHQGVARPGHNLAAAIGRARGIVLVRRCQYHQIARIVCRNKKRVLVVSMQFEVCRRSPV
jgi:hypothetical protein